MGRVGVELLSVLWTISSPSLTGAELFHLEERPAGFTLRGRVVAMVEGVPAVVDYRVRADRSWVTRSVKIALDSGRAIRRMNLEHDGLGSWSVDGASQPGLEGCLDIDLAISPSTNTLPIRRLKLGRGEVATVTATWLRFPELASSPLPQTYERMGAHRYRYRSGSFQADLVVDDQGIVVRYGADLWQAVGRTST